MDLIVRSRTTKASSTRRDLVYIDSQEKAKKAGCFLLFNVATLDYGSKRPSTMKYGAFIFSRRTDLEDLLIELDQFLDRCSDKITRTRKGRVWDIELPIGRPFHVDVTNTEEIPWIEDELLELNLLPEDAPFTISISSSLGREIDWRNINKLVRDLELISNGVSAGPST